MIHIVYADEIDRHPRLFDSMFRDRAFQFRNRLKWEVNVDEFEHEKDEFDACNPLYLIVADDDETHLGSMRFLPTTGDTMINTKLTALTGGVTVRSPFIWECTRFCLAPNANRGTSWSILAGTIELGLFFKVQFFVGVFSQHMSRVYRRLGYSPVVIGSGNSPQGNVCAGLWRVSEAARTEIMLGRSAARSKSCDIEFSKKCSSARLLLESA